MHSYHIMVQVLWQSTWAVVTSKLDLPKLTPLEGNRHGLLRALSLFVLFSLFSAISAETLHTSHAPTYQRPDLHRG